jgi:hypothetical protein
MKHLVCSTFFRWGSSVLLAAISASTFAAGSAPKPTICARSCWAARAPSGSISQMSSLNRAIVHHTAGNEFGTTGLEDSKARVRAIQNFHMNSNGWSDVGYHFLVDKFGNIFEGRSGSMSTLSRGAHDGFNANSFGFNCMGYFHPTVNNVPTAAMMNSLYDVIAWRMPSAWRPMGTPGGTYGDLGNSVGYVDAHRRVKATACPGDGLYNPYMGSNMSAGTIRTQILNRINGAPATPPSAPSGLSAMAVSGTQINLGWTDTSSNETNFVVARGTVSGGPYTDVATLGANVTSYNNTGLAGNTTYYYVVRSTNTAGASANSAQASAVTFPAEIIIDNSSAGFTASANWSTGTSAADKFGTDYRFRATEAISDVATWNVTLPQSRNYEVYAWWSQGTNRAAAATYTLPDASTAAVNQQSGGGAWNSLGIKALTAGAGTVKLSCWSTTGFVVVADGVRLVPR